jgi:REP element-mobilizing transposase RayT
MKNHGLPELIRAFKTFSARKINKVYGNQPPTIWQRGYFDRVIRNVNELDRIREYIRANPENFGNKESFH